MTSGNFRRVFGDTKPVIAMVHLGALPGSPLHDRARGLPGLIEAAAHDLAALQAAGFDAVMFGNENDRPYELKVDVASTASMACVIGALRHEVRVPFGVDVLWDPMATVALAAATGAAFVREIFTGTYASDMGPWTPDAAQAARYRDRLGRSDLALLDNVSAEFAWSLDRRPLPDRARSAVFSSIPDAVLVSGQITGEAAPLCDLEAVKGIELTRQGARDEQIIHTEQREDLRGNHYYWIGYRGRLSDPPAGTDLRAVYDGHVSVTPLHVDLTHHEVLREMRTWARW